MWLHILEAYLIASTCLAIVVYQEIKKDTKFFQYALSAAFLTYVWPLLIVLFLVARFYSIHKLRK